MADPKTLHARVETLESLLADKFGLSRGPLSVRLTKLGRRVPASVHRDLQQVEQARFLSGHPKLQHVMDPQQISAAYSRAMDHLTAINVAERRKGRAINLLATILFNLLVVGVVFIAVLVWQDLL